MSHSVDRDEAPIESEVQELRRQVRLRDDALNDSRGEVVALSEVQLALEAQVRSHEDQAVERSLELRELHTALDDATRARDLSRREASALDSRLTEESARLDTARRRIQSLEDSLSWRLTAPARWLVKRVRGY